jgi:hypothetical protein
MVFQSQDGDTEAPTPINEKISIYIFERVFQLIPTVHVHAVDQNPAFIRYD